MPLSLLLASALLAAPAAPSASSGAVKLVEQFLKTPTAELPPERIPEFLSIAPATLPAKLRDGYTAKKLELLSLKKIADGKYRPPVRMLGKEAITGCGGPEELASIQPLLKTGFAEITEQEEAKLIEETGCSECELRTEFSLQLIVTPPLKKGQKKRLHYILMEADPVMAYIAAMRQGRSARTSSFFGIGGSVKCR